MKINTFLSLPKRIRNIRGLVYSCDLGDVHIPKEPLDKLLWAYSQKEPNKTALVCGITGRSYTYREAAKCSASVTSWFLDQGGEQGDVVAAVLSNSPEYTILFSGVAGAGLAMTPINHSFTGPEIAKQIEAANSKWVITDSSSKLKIFNALSGICSPVYISVDGEKPNVESLLYHQGSTRPFSPPTENTVAQLPYSSGTTGLPKGVMLTHGNIAANLAQMAHPDVGFFYPDDRVVVVNPLYHVYAMNTTTINLMVAGGTAITLPQFEPKSFLAALERWRPTVLQLPPPLISFLADHPSVTAEHLENLRYVMVGAAPVGKALEQRWQAKAPGVPLREGYGMTESTPMTIMTRAGRELPGSTGQLIPSTQARIVSTETGEDVPLGEAGELLVRGPQVMAGYLNNPEATKATLKDGWLHTGDVVRCDAAGFFYVVDRLKELIKVKGLQVAPAELENLVRSLDGVADCAVLGVPHPRAGQVPRAVVVKGRENLTVDEVKSHVAQRASRHKHLDGGVVFAESIPRSAAGKILRNPLREQFSS